MEKIPLSNGFVLTAMLGLIISGYLTLAGYLQGAWAFILNFMFIIFLTAGFVSIAPENEK